MAGVPSSIQRFRIEGVLGEGGMGTVYRAYDPELERAVAIKVLGAPSARLEVLDEHRTVDLRDDRPRTEHDLLAEARVMAAISHPNVLPVFEVGRFGDKVFLVMELIDGIDLRRWIGTHTVAEIMPVLVAAARGLAAAHARGVVHGDFKPDNVLIGRDGRVCVADFGVSSFVNGPRASLVRVDDARGTPAYLAPEVWRGDPITPAADVYAFATTAAEALLGARHDSPEEVARALDQRGVPAYMRDAIVHGLAREPSARPADLVAALGAPPKRVRWVVPAIAATVLAAGAAIFVATRGSGRVCEPVSHADVWSDARVAELRAHAVPDDVIATMTKRFAEVDALRTSSCEDREAGKLGSVQHGTIAVCLDRLVIEYDERIKATLAKPDRATNLLGSPPIAEDCRNRRDTVFDPKKQREIIARFIASVAAPRDELRRELVALMPMAVEAGDHELAARLADLHGSELAVQRDLSGARKAMQQARAYAQQSGSAMTELRVVTQHLKIERFHDNLALARLLANDAKVLIERVPAGTPYAEQTMLEIATLATARGEYPEARDYNRRLLEILERTNRGNGSAALERRIQIVNITPQLDEPSPPDFKKFIEDTQVLLDKVYADKSKSGYRAGLFALAEGYRAIKDPRADKLIEDGLELLRDEKPEPGNSVLAHRATIAGQLFVRDRQDEAIGILRDVVRESGRADANDVAAANKRFTHTFGLALMLFATDQSGEAHAMAEDALLEITGKLGPNHAETRQVLELLVLIELERKDFARAEKHIDAIERALRAEPSAEGSASTTILHASVARLRGDLATAEKLAREALTTATEIRARGSLLQTANRELGRVLVALGRDAEALPYLIAGLPAANQFGIRDCIAEFEVAKVERAVGKRAEGDARAKSCLAHIKGVKSFAPRRREVEAWLAAP